MPQLIDIHDAYGKQVAILSINPINPQGQVLSDLSRFDLPFPALVGRGSSIIRDYQIRNLPSIYVIDKAGKVVEGGKFITPERLEELIQSLIKPAPSAE